MSDSVELLFFDTFAHENSEELNLDLVQFPKPVYVTEVRIIPLGARVQADFPGGVRLGATNPSQFRIEFFVNDLGKPGASTFETLGGFEYNQNGCINLECVPDDLVRKIPTDGLVLRGWYTTITLAVYGTLTTNISEQVIPPVVTPALPAQPNTIADVQQIIPQNSIETEWPQDNTVQPVSLEYTQQAATPYPQTYPQTETYPQEYPEYYNEVPKDPRSYHHTPESDWESKNRGRSMDVERDRERDRERSNRDGPYQKSSNIDHEHSRIESDRRDRDRERRYSRSHSRDRDRQSRDYSDSNRDRDHQRDWDHDRHDYRDRSKKDWDRSERSDRDRDRDRSFEHQDSYRRYGREDREEPRKRPRTPPIQSPKRPHTPHVIDHNKNLSPPDVETLSEDEQSIAEKQKKEKEVPESTRTNSKSPIKDVKENQSPVNIGNEEAPSMDAEEFEPILSDEDILDDADHYQDLDYDYNTYTNNDDLIKMFIPGCTDLQKYRVHPPYVISDDKFEIDEELKTTIAIADDFFKSSITKYTLTDFEKLDREIKEELVHLCEKIMPTIGDVDHFCCIVEIYAKIKNREAKDLFAQVKYIIETILDWFIIMLNYDMANSQNQPGYKIRHIKWGARLAEWCCNSVHFIELLWEQNFHIDKVLLSLYTREYMALSVKLMILRALDKYLQHKSTVKKFIADGIDVAKQNGYFNDVASHESNGYKALVELLRENPLVRLKFALNSILKKLNLFEVLQKLQSTVGKARNENCTLSNEDINFILKSLDQILHTCHSGSFALSQPKRFLPVSAQFEVNRIDTQNVLIEFFKMFNLLQCFVVLLTQSNTMNKSSVKAPIYEILSELLLTKEGLDYLCENCDTVNLLLKCLLQSDEDLQFSLSDFAEVKSHNLGLEIAYKVQCLYHVRCLLDIGKKFEYDCDSTDVINQLHALFCLTFTNIGKISICEILGMDDNIRCLMQFLEMANVREKSELHFTKLRKSPAMSYIVDLLSFVIINVPNIPVLEKYSKQLLQVIYQHDAFEPYISTKLNELMPFVKPLEHLMPLNYDNISAIVELVSKYLDYATTYPGQLITGLRVLQLLGISRHASKLPVISENPLSNYIELKYKHVILQLYSLDGVTILTKLLQKIADFYEQPALHTYVFVSVQGVHIINTVQPAVELLKQMLTYVIQCRNTNFKDLTSIPVLLQIYTLLHSFPSNSLLYLKARKTCRDLIETLLVYTQPVSDEIHEKDSLNKTLWTLMCGEVIKYITTAPYTFVPGLLIFSELLPLPLPIQSLEKLRDDEVSWMINLRKLWSAHLHSHSSNIQELLARMCTTTHQPLLNLLKRICVQLSDLAANSAVMIARGILDTIHTALIPKDDSKLQACNGHVARLLYFLACLMTHGSLKCAILQLLQNNVSLIKGDEKYPALIDVFAQILKLQNNSSSHVQAQECILNIIQSFSDTEITLLQASLEEYGALSSEIYLANALPRKEHLVLYISTIIEHLMNNDNTLVTYLPIVRTLVLLTEHDYGFYFLRECLNKKSEPLLNILNKLEKCFSKDNDDCLSILNIVIQFLQVCSTPEEVEGPVLFKPRTMKMSVADIRAVVGWKTPNEENEPKHPIFVLEDHLKNIIKDDNTFKSLLENTSALIKLLSSEQTSDVKENHTEPVLPPPEPLLVQFAHRTVFSITETIDERFTSAYWLSVPSDDADNDLENVTCDLTEVCRQHLPQEINLVREVEKLCRIYPSDGLEQAEKEKRNDSQKDKMRRPFVTPTRGRGFARTVPQRGDLFRSRPPNTSRPPSLHVDDFVALETCGAQPTGPTGYNKISRELLATSRVARGTRGRPFMMPERAVQYRQVPWWGVGIGRAPYQ